MSHARRDPPSTPKILHEVQACTTETGRPRTPRADRKKVHRSSVAWQEMKRWSTDSDDPPQRPHCVGPFHPGIRCDRTSRVTRAPRNNNHPNTRTFAGARTDPALVLTIIFCHKLLTSQFRRPNPPPSPPSLPIIGHLHLLGVPLHHTLTRLSAAYGPILALRLGSRRALIVSSPSAVAECFSTHDLIFANRPQLPAVRDLSYNYTSLVAANYGPHWRNLRRLTKNFFSSAVHTDDVHMMLQEIHGGGATVDLRSLLTKLTFDVIIRLIAGKKTAGSEEGRRFRRIAEEVMRVSQVRSAGDLLPWLAWFDFGGLEKRRKELARELDEFYQEMIEEKRRERGEKGEEGGGRGGTVIDVLLTMQENVEEGGYYSDIIIKGVILSLILAGTDTSAVTMEWAMSLLLNHPKALQNCRAEIDMIVGHGRLVNQNDLPKLQCLNNIINETLRMYPAVPLLLPHESSTDCKFKGYDIPRGTILFVNAYAIHRDPDLWVEPTSFNPERFSGGGDGGMMLPFGMGRRSCPGEGLAMRMMGLVLGSMIQCFEWERIGDNDVDMREGEGLTMPKVKALEAKCRAREIMVHVLDGLHA